MKRHELVYHGVKNTHITAETAARGIQRIKKERKELDKAQLRVVKREHKVDQLDQALRAKFLKKDSKAHCELCEQVHRLSTANAIFEKEKQ